MLRCYMPNLTKVSCSVIFEHSGYSGSQVWCVGWAAPVGHRRGNPAERARKPNLGYSLARWR